MISRRLVFVGILFELSEPQRFGLGDQEETEAGEFTVTVIPSTECRPPDCKIAAKFAIGVYVTVLLDAPADVFHATGWLSW